MNFSEWIGLFITMIVLFYLMSGKKSPPAQETQEDKLKEFLESLDEDMSSKKKPVPPPVPLPLFPKAVKTKVVLPKKAPEVNAPSIVSAYFEKSVQYEVMGKAAPSRAHRLLHTLKQKGDMVILHEIIGPPKCKRR
jgi:hypothetical protein